MVIKNTTSVIDREVLQGSGSTLSQGITTNGFLDGTNTNPSAASAAGGPVAKGGKNLNLSGAIIPEDILLGDTSGYLTTYVQESPAGHVIEINDTPGSERIMIRHTDGTGINIGPDGSVVVSSNKRVDVVSEGYHLSVGGDGSLTYKGNLTLKVEGDFNVEVNGKYNVKAAEYSKTVYGNESKSIYGDQSNVITSNRSDIILGSSSTTIKGGHTLMVKEDYTVGVQGNSLHATSGILTMTAEAEVICTSPDINMAATNLSVFGSTGTIGGDNIIMYTKNLYAQKTVWAETMNANLVYGDLEGRAKEAITADVANSQSYAENLTGTAASWTVDDTETDNTATVLPTSSLLSDYLDKGSKGVRRVIVDPEDIITNTIDKTIKTGGLTQIDLDTAGVRSKMRDPANRSNTDFVSSQIASGALSPEYVRSTPPNISRVRDVGSVTIRGSETIGNVYTHQNQKRVRGV